ncbi:MAG: transketolase, partial [Desulfobacula sp.]|nr:transketolase [Desulfobacula sp.]
TRAASGQVLNAIADNLPALMGGSADLAPSNKTYLNGSIEFQKDTREGRNIRFGVREHAMGAIMSGMYLHSGIRPYGGTFLVFADYMRPAIRMATLMKLPLIYVFTHDSVAVGEDGPTHQPVEHVASLRAIPGLTVVRPADANETALAWKQALKTVDSPTALILSRQKLPTLDVSQRDGEFNYGAYTIKNDQDPDMILIATGSEVHICVTAADILEKDHNIKAAVVSMPSWELFEKAPAPYRERILPFSVTKRIAVEAGISMGWEKYTGQEGKIIGIDKFGASAPGGTVLKEYGFSPDNIVKNALNLFKS